MSIANYLFISINLQSKGIYPNIQHIGAGVKKCEQDTGSGWQLSVAILRFLLNKNSNIPYFALLSDG